jgi:hypothetical protein
MKYEKVSICKDYVRATVNYLLYLHSLLKYNQLTSLYLQSRDVKKVVINEQAFRIDFKLY